MSEPATPPPGTGEAPSGTPSPGVSEQSAGIPAPATGESSAGAPAPGAVERSVGRTTPGVGEPAAGAPAPGVGEPAAGVPALATGGPSAGVPAPEAGVLSAGGEAAGVVDEEARRARVERAVRGTLAGALILEALMVLFVPRTIAPLEDGGLSGGGLAFLLGLAGALLVAAVLQRRRFGLGLGTVLQLPVIATGFLIGVMFVLGAIFAGLWVYMLRARRDLLRPARPPAAS